eukprot:166561_1
MIYSMVSKAVKRGVAKVLKQCPIRKFNQASSCISARERDLLYEDRCRRSAAKLPYQRYSDIESRLKALEGLSLANVKAFARAIFGANGAATVPMGAEMCGEYLLQCLHRSRRRLPPALPERVAARARHYPA